MSRTKLQREYTILIDKREKTPLVFPEWIVMPLAPYKQTEVRLKTKVVTLDAGDYVLEGEESLCGIERKGHITEISKNLLTKKDRPRFLKAFDKLRDDFQRPILLIEGSPTQLLRPGKYAPEPELALSHLMRESTIRGIEFLVLPSSTISTRRAVGIIAANLLIQTAVHGWDNENPQEGGVGFVRRSTG